jgi:hypothetical protein
VTVDVGTPSAAAPVCATTPMIQKRVFENVRVFTRYLVSGTHDLFILTSGLFTHTSALVYDS